MVVEVMVVEVMVVEVMVVGVVAGDLVMMVVGLRCNVNLHFGCGGEDHDGVSSAKLAWMGKISHSDLGRESIMLLY